MLNYLFSFFSEGLPEDKFQQGHSDYLEGKLPKTDDSNYIRGYLSNRPRGMDDEIQHFPTLEEYLYWKQRHRGTVPLKGEIAKTPTSKDF